VDQHVDEGKDGDHACLVTAALPHDGVDCGEDFEGLLAAIRGEAP
jgi:hypothetical protein